MSKTDVEEQAFDAANRIKRMIQETAPKDVVQLNEFILSVITEVLVDTVTASCEQLVDENTRMRTAIEQTICWQESVDASNTESVRHLLELEAPATYREKCQMIEDAKKAIYASWESQPGWVPWVESGNSAMQSKAHALAIRIIGGVHE